MSIVFHISAAAKKRVARRQFLGSASGKVLASLAAICAIGAVGLFCVSPQLLSDPFMHEQLGIAVREIPDMRQDIRILGSVLLLVCALLLIACGYRQVTESTAQRRLESLRIEGGRLVYEFKMRNDVPNLANGFSSDCMNVVSIGLADCDVATKDGVATFSGDVLGAYVLHWSEKVDVPLDMFGLLTKPFKLGLYFEPDLLETIRPLVKSIEEG